MTPIKNAQDEFVDRIRARVDKLGSVVESMMRKTLRKNEMETLARIERAKKSVSDKGETLQLRLDEASTAEESEWDETRERLEAAWIEYREAVDRARLEFERAGEFS